MLPETLLYPLLWLPTIDHVMNENKTAYAEYGKLYILSMGTFVYPLYLNKANFLKKIMDIIGYFSSYGTN